jgi:hypothetical protein
MLIAPLNYCKSCFLIVVETKCLHFHPTAQHEFARGENTVVGYIHIIDPKGKDRKICVARNGVR